MKRILLGVAMMVASSGAFALVGGAPAIASASTPRPYVCSGGSFPTNPVPVHSGTYTSLIVTGFCQAPAGAEITVTGNVTVALGGVFDAQTYPSTVTVGGSVLVGRIHSWAWAAIPTHRDTRPATLALTPKATRQRLLLTSPSTGASSPRTPPWCY